MKAVRELGSVRGDTARLFSVKGYKDNLHRVYSTKGPQTPHLWFISCNKNCTAEQLSVQTERLKASRAGKLCKNKSLYLVVDHHLYRYLVNQRKFFLYRRTQRS